MTAAGTLFMIVAPATALQAITGLGGTVMMVAGRTDIQLRTTIESGVLWIMALLISVRFGLEWAAIAYNCVALLYTLRYMKLVLPLVECSSRVYIKVFIIPLILTGICSIVYIGIAHIFPRELIQLIFATILLLVAIGAGAFLQRRSILEGNSLMAICTHVNAGESLSIRI